MYFAVELNTSKTLLYNVIHEWNKLDPNIHSSSSYNSIRNVLLKLIRPNERKIFNINDPFGTNMLARLRLGFRHLHEHKFRQGLKGTLNPLYSCSIEVESPTHYFLRCHFYNSNRATLMNDLENIPIPLPTVSYNDLISLLLHGDDKKWENINVSDRIH